MPSAGVSQQVDHPAAETVRLHYLDWLRVAAILGVFLYHAVHPFDLTDWHIKNAELSELITAFLLFVSPWGMPFFFLIAGSGTWFALRHRTARQYVTERFQRLLIPFICGCLLLTPLMLYVEWLHKTQIGLMTGSFWEFVGGRPMPISCQFFGWAGYHLWFLGFLFSFSLLALPVFLWLRGASGQVLTTRLAALSERRGSLLLGIVPLLVIQLALRPFFTQGEHNWADFFFLMGFFVLGYMLYSDVRFAHAVRRDSRLMVGIGALTSAIGIGVIAFADGFNWTTEAGSVQFYFIWTLIVINGWCWVVSLLALGMRSLDFSNRWLRSGQEAILPFFVLHQPVIMVVAFFVVQWEAGILPKMLVVVPVSFVATFGIYELLIRRIGWLRRMFGMKSRASEPTQTASSAQSHAHAH